MNKELRSKVHRSEEEWQEIYEEHVSKGGALSSFCKSKGIAPSTYNKWYRKFSGKLEQTVKFKELSEARVLKDKIGESTASTCNLSLELDFGSGVILRISK